VRHHTVITAVAVAVLTGVAAASARADVASPGPGTVAADALGIAAHIRDAAMRHRVSERVIAAIIRVESNFNPRAVSPSGALGLMQLMPLTARIFGAHDAFDPAQNITAGARYLRQLLDRFGHDLPRALAAYNAGEQAVLRHGGIPPYPETRAFVARVLDLVRRDPGRPQPATAEDARVAYHPRAALDAFAVGVAKERVLEALATEWIQARDALVKVEGVRIVVSRRSPGRALVEAGEVTLLEAGGTVALHWLLFEDGRLLSTGRAGEWPKAAPRAALDLQYTPGGPPVP
jgi:hypothetical protein